MLRGQAGATAHRHQERLVQAAIREVQKLKADCLKFVQWSDADRLFVGGVCQGAAEQKVYRELTKLVAEEIAETQRARRSLPEKCAQVTMPVAV